MNFLEITDVFKEVVQQYIDDLDSVQGIERIAFEILGLINPDTIIIDPQN